MYQKHKITVVIPALNEAKSIAQVIEEIPDGIDEVIVVDNGSQDNTKAIAQQAGARVLEQNIRGYGASCLKGIKNASSPDILVILDGDLSDYPDQMPRLLDPIVNHEADFVIGSRVLGEYEKGSLTPQQYYGNKLACFLMKIFFGFSFTDMGPFRAIRFDHLNAYGMQDPNFGWNVEMQVKGIRYGSRIQEVAVDYRKRIGQSKISGTILGTIKAGYKIIFTIFYYVFCKDSPSRTTN